MALNLRDEPAEDNGDAAAGTGGSGLRARGDGDRIVARQIAAGMTHDLGNLFAAILAQVDLAQGSLEILDIVGVDRDLEDIRVAVLRGSRMVEQMLAFGRGEALGLSTVDLGQVVESVAPVLRPLLPEGVTLRVERDSAPPVRADAGAVERVVMNLALRARDAMADGGRLTIRVGSATLTRADYCRRGWGTPGRYGAITISDEGAGIPADQLAQLFEPFAAAPEADGGDHLVLAYALMKQHRGFVDVTSEAGQGTEVRLLFRTAPAAAVDTGARHTRASTSLAGSGAGSDSRSFADRSS
jgi:signal transduction histidine kinase